MCGEEISNPRLLQRIGTVLKLQAGHCGPFIWRPMKKSSTGLVFSSAEVWRISVERFQKRPLSRSKDLRSYCCTKRKSTRSSTLNLRRSAVTYLLMGFDGFVATLVLWKKQDLASIPHHESTAGPGRLLWLKWPRLWDNCWEAIETRVEFWAIRNCWDACFKVLTFFWNWTHPCSHAITLLNLKASLWRPTTFSEILKRLETTSEREYNWLAQQGANW